MAENSQLAACGRVGTPHAAAYSAGCAGRSGPLPVFSGRLVSGCPTPGTAHSCSHEPAHYEGRPASPPDRRGMEFQKGYWWRGNLDDCRQDWQQDDVERQGSTRLIGDEIDQFDHRGWHLTAAMTSRHASPTVAVVKDPFLVIQGNHGCPNSLPSLLSKFVRRCLGLTVVNYLGVTSIFETFRD